jgi:transposase
LKVASEPEALLQVLGNPIYRFKRIGTGSRPLSQWLFSALAEEKREPVSDIDTAMVVDSLKAALPQTAD